MTRLMKYIPFAVKTESHIWMSIRCSETGAYSAHIYKYMCIIWLMAASRRHHFALMNCITKIKRYKVIIVTLQFSHTNYQLLVNGAKRSIASWLVGWLAGWLDGLLHTFPCDGFGCSYRATMVIIEVYCKIHCLVNHIVSDS